MHKYQYICTSIYLYLNICTLSALIHFAATVATYCLLNTNEIIGGTTKETVLQTLSPNNHTHIPIVFPSPQMLTAARLFMWPH